MRREGLPEGQQEWLEALADEYPDQEWVVKAAYPDGRIEFEAEVWHGLYWEAWEALRFDRQYGAFGGETPIPYMVIRAYAEDHGIVGDDLWLFRALMNVIDSEWLKHVANRDKEGGKSNG